MTTTDTTLDARWLQILLLCAGCAISWACDGIDTSAHGGELELAAGGAAGAGGALSGGSGGSPAAGGTNAGGSAGGPVFGEPIDAPAEQWTWVPFDDAFCADGSTTGIGINPSEQAELVIIYLMGGGACWDDFTCYLLHTAAHIEGGYGAAEFGDDVATYLSGGQFDRDDPDNPFRDASFVFIPYCTGDVHSGNRVANYSKPTRHVGRANMRAYLQRIVPSFPNATRVLVAGSSAGGFGAAMNWGVVQEYFGGVRVDMLDDSGPPLPAPYMSESLEQAWRTQWGLDEGLPKGCADCLEDLDAVFRHYGEKYPESRFALLSYTQDSHTGTFFQLTGPEVEAGLDTLVQSSFAPYPQMHFFFVEGDGHVLLETPQVSQNGVVLIDWLAKMLGDDPSWASVQP